MDREFDLQELFNILVEMGIGDGYEFGYEQGRAIGICQETGEVFDVGQMLLKAIAPMPEGTLIN